MARVWVTRGALSTIEREAVRKRLVETGGCLVGYESEAGDEAVVTEAFGPGPNARHRPRTYRPDESHTQAVLNRVHLESHGRYTYLGEWHTHPLGRARPSGRDIASVRSIAAQPEVELPQPVILIQATALARRHVSLRELAAFRLDEENDEVVRAELRLMSNTGF